MLIVDIVVVYQYSSQTLRHVKPPNPLASVHRPRAHFIIILCCFDSGGCAIAPSALVGKDVIGTLYDFPWALLLTGIGGVISALTMLFTIVLSCQANTERRQIQPSNVSTVNQGGSYYNPGYSAPLGVYPQPVNVTDAYGGASSNQIYPNLSAPGPNLRSEKQYSSPSAPPFEMA